MTPRDDTERRLRDALHQRATEVREGDLTRSFVELERPRSAAGRRPGRSWMGAAAAAVAIAAAAVGIGVVSRHGDVTPAPVATQTVSASPDPTGTPSGTAKPTASATRGVTGWGPIAAQEQPRSAIPWSQVGPGWVVGVWGASRAAQTGTLYLVSPTATRYAIASIPTNVTVVDVSPDGRRALTQSLDTSQAVSEWDLTGGTSRLVPQVSGRLVPGVSGLVRYSRPTAKALLVSVNPLDPLQGHLERRGLDGSLQLTFPVGSAAGIETPDGLFVVAQGSTGLTVFGNSTGAVVRSLPAPSGYGGCSPISWWSDGRAVVSCSRSDGTDVSNVWLYPVSGGPPAQLTQASSLAQRGYVDAWQLSGGVLLEQAQACGYGPLDIQIGNAAPRSLGPELKGVGKALAGTDPVTVVNDSAYVLLASGDCSMGDGIGLVNVLTGASGTLLGPQVNGGTVFQFAVVGPSR